MIYRAATGLAGAVLGLRGGDWRERLVQDAPPAPAAIWVHGASVGELTSARILIEALAPLGLIVTANSVTGRDMARGWGVAARLAPFDAPGALARFLDALRPRVALTLEAEIWPNRSAALAARGVAQVVAGARMSQRSARRWGRLPGLIAPSLRRITALSAQDAASEARLLALGLPRAALRPRLDLKRLGPALTPPAPPGPARDLTFLAASTHEGEDAPIIDAYLAARRRVPGLRLILAPRHPARGDAIAALMTARGLHPARRSAGADEGAPVLLADTLGEMARWYRAAGLCLTAGSITDHGGHTPWEPAAHGCAILHGPHLSNFTDAYARLDAAGAAFAFDAGCLAGLAGDPARARAAGQAARAVLMRDAGDPAALLAELRDLAQGRANPDIGGD